MNVPGTDAVLLLLCTFGARASVIRRSKKPSGSKNPAVNHIPQAIVAIPTAEKRCSIFGYFGPQGRGYQEMRGSGVAALGPYHDRNICRGCKK